MWLVKNVYHFYTKMIRFSLFSRIWKCEFDETMRWTSNRNVKISANIIIAAIKYDVCTIGKIKF